MMAPFNPGQHDSTSSKRTPKRKASNQAASPSGKTRKSRSKRGTPKRQAPTKPRPSAEENEDASVCALNTKLTLSSPMFQSLRNKGLKVCSVGLYDCQSLKTLLTGNCLKFDNSFSYDVLFFIVGFPSWECCIQCWLHTEEGQPTP